MGFFQSIRNDLFRSLLQRSSFWTSPDVRCLLLLSSSNAEHDTVTCCPSNPVPSIPLASMSMGSQTASGLLVCLHPPLFMQKGVCPRPPSTAHTCDNLTADIIKAIFIFFGQITETIRFITSKARDGSRC